MLKANELRIGNYHYYHIVDKFNDPKEWDDICQIDGQDIVYLERNPNDTDYKPIPLTEEWLLKFGFKEDGTRPDWCDLLSSYNIGNDKIQYLRNESWKCLKIRYVHQLQNLYFALTGQELTIK